MNRERLQATIDALAGVLDVADGDVDVLERAHIELGSYIDQLRRIPTKINTKIVRRSA